MRFGDRVERDQPRAIAATHAISLPSSLASNTSDTSQNFIQQQQTDSYSVWIYTDYPSIYSTQQTDERHDALKSRWCFVILL